MNAEGTATEYICMECKHITLLKLKDPVRCSQCGKCILYKTRNKRNPIQMQAI